MNFTQPSVGPENMGPLLRETALAAEEIGSSWSTMMDHYFQFGALRNRARSDARGLQLARIRRSGHEADAAGPHGHGRHLPASGPPILIGGGGEKKTLRLVAQYADACNLFASDVETVAHKIDLLKRHCDDLGRDFSEIQITMMGPAAHAAQDPDAFLRSMEEYSALSISLVELANVGPDSVGFVRGLRPLVPRLAAIGAGVGA